MPPDSSLPEKSSTASMRPRTDTKIPVVVIFAPTACGKTALIEKTFGKGGLAVFKDRAEIISADSQSVYRGMNIGTAKPSAGEMEQIPYHLVNIADPSEQFGAGEFIEYADRACKDIYSRSKIPVLAGGTGFYIRNFLLGLPVTPASDPAIRESLKQRLESAGSQSIYAELTIADPVSAKRINPHDNYRILRALEVYYTCGRPLSSFALPSEPRKQYDFLTIILTRPREELFSRIDERVEKMFSEGLEEEVQSLVKKGYGADSPGMKAIGYSEFFIPGLNTAQIKERIKLDSRHYAKKQYTFMRGIPGAKTFSADDEEAIQSELKLFFRSAAKAE